MISPSFGYDENGKPLETESYFAWSDRPPGHREKLFATSIDERGPYTSVTCQIHSCTMGRSVRHSRHCTECWISIIPMGRGGLETPIRWVSGMKQSEFISGTEFFYGWELYSDGTGIVDIDMELLGVTFDEIIHKRNPPLCRSFDCGNFIFAGYCIWGRESRRRTGRTGTRHRINGDT